VGTDPAQAVLGHGIHVDRSSFLRGGEGRWRTDSATNLRRKAFDSCKLFCICLASEGLRSQTPTRAPSLNPTGGLPSPRPSVPTLTSEPGYATVKQASAMSIYRVCVNCLFTVADCAETDGKITECTTNDMWNACRQRRKDGLVTAF